MTLPALRPACGPRSLLIVVAAMLLLSSPASIAMAESGPARLRVAVLDFDVNDLTGDVHEPERHGRFMANAFEASLVQSRRFTVLTRLDLEKVLDEQALDVSGVVNPEQARAFGVAGVDVIITGSITVLGEASYAVSARYIDVVTGEVFDAEHVQTSGPDGFIGIATQLVERVAARLPLQGHVIGEEDDGVVIDIGMEHGLVGPGETGGVYRVRSIAGRRGLQAIGTFVVRYAFQDVALVDVELADGEAVEPGDVVIVGASGLAHPSSEDPSLARAPSTGTVRIEGGPVGAEVTAGDAPPVALPREGVELQLPTGVQRLRVTAEGYLPLERLVAVEPDGVALVEVHLAPRPGSISFLVEPSAAMVFVNDSMVGSGSVVVDGLAAGPVRYRVEARGFDPHEGLVTVPPGGFVERQVRLQPLHDDAATPDIATIAGGRYHSLALLDDGTIWAWGTNWTGRLGDGTRTSRTTPTQVHALTNVRSIAAGSGHSIALRDDGTIWAWGANASGQLGDGTTTHRTTPTQVPTLTTVRSIAAGGDHSIALRDDGTIWTWGANGLGQLGDGTTSRRTTPTQVQDLTNVRSIAAGGDHSIALLDDGTIWTWGFNVAGQLGDGTTSRRTTPSQVPTLTNVRSIAAGERHSLALLDNGTIWAWGSNTPGQLGDGTTTNRTTPTQVRILTNVRSIAAGGIHSLALLDDGTVWTWGFNNHGQLGDGTTTNRTTPTRIATLSGIRTLGKPRNHPHTALEDGAFWSWCASISDRLSHSVAVPRWRLVQVRTNTVASKYRASLQHVPG